VDEPPNLPLILMTAGVTLAVMVGALVLIAKFYRRVPSGRALVIHTMQQDPVVAFTSRVVFPIVHRAEELDVSVRTLEIERSGRNGLVCQDGLLADVRVTFYVRVNPTADDVLRVARSVGCARASDPAALRELFEPKFSGALETVARAMTFDEIGAARERFKDQVIALIGTDLDGFRLDDVAVRSGAAQPPGGYRDPTRPR
jgi:uncharacterized membrane protein YqiK